MKKNTTIDVKGCVDAYYIYLAWDRLLGVVITGMKYLPCSDENSFTS
jgi:hypothetical protein